VGGGRGKGHGTGSPIAFRCWRERREWRPGLRENHVVTLTGRKRPYQSARYSVHGARSDHFAREYVCSCGHTGWSAHIDLAYMAGDRGRG